MPDITPAAATAAPAATPAIPTTPQSTAQKTESIPKLPDSAPDEPITAEEEAELAASTENKDNKEAVPSKRKLKVDGEVLELTEEEYEKYASLGKAAQKRMEEAAKIRKEHEKLQKDVEVFLDVLQKEPERVLKDLGIDPKEFAKAVINKQMEDDAKTPEQKEKETLQKKLEDAEKRIKDAEEAKKKEEIEKHTAEAASKLEKDIISAIESGSLPQHASATRRVVDLMVIAASQGYNLDASDVIPIVKEQYLNEFKEVSKIMGIEMLEEVLGNEMISELRKRYIKKIKQVPTTPKDIQPTGQETKELESTQKKKIKAKDFFNKLGTF